MDGSGDKVSLELEGRALAQDRGDLARVDVGAAHLAGRRPRRRYQDRVEGAETGAPLVHARRGRRHCAANIFDRSADGRNVHQHVLLDCPRPKPILVCLTCNVAKSISTNLKAI